MMDAEIIQGLMERLKTGEDMLSKMEEKEVVWKVSRVLEMLPALLLVGGLCAVLMTAFSPPTSKARHKYKSNLIVYKSSH